MADDVERPSRHAAWCVGGFLFPVALMALGLVFERGHPPDEAELARARADVLSGVVVGLLVCHAGAGLLAVVRWPDRGWVWLATAVQFGCSLVTGFLAGMAVSGEWL